MGHIKNKIPLYTRRILRLLFLILWEMLKKWCRCVCRSQNVCPGEILTEILVYEKGGVIKHVEAPAINKVEVLDL